MLQNNPNPMSMSEIRIALNDAVPQRTLRRYLHALSEQGQIAVHGNNKNRKYQYIPKSISGSDAHHIFSEQSLTVINKLHTPLYLREPCSYNRAWLQEYIPNTTYYFSKRHRDLLFEHGSQMIDAEPAGTYAHKIYQRLLIDLSYNSSRLEGNTYSILDTEKLLFEGTPAQDKLDSEKIMILNHKEAIRYLIEGISNISVSTENIRTMHYLLADGLVPKQDTGNIRNDSVKISGSVYMPLDNAQDIEGILDVIANKASQIIDPFEQSIFLLIHLSYLQTFIDVNKRTARLVCNIPFIKHNLVPLAFNEIDINDYRSAMIVIYEFNNIMPLIDLYVWSYIRTAKQYKTTVESLGFDAIRIQYRAQRRALLHNIIKNKMTTGITSYVMQFAEQHIPAVDRNKFIADVLLDLDVLDATKIVGLGVSKAEFQEWKKLF